MVAELGDDRVADDLRESPDHTYAPFSFLWLLPLPRDCQYRPNERKFAGDRPTISCFSVAELIVDVSGVVRVARDIEARFSHSLALLADFGHMLSDSFALGLALLATWIAQGSADKQGSFFSGRQEAIAAPIDGVGLVIMASWIAWEAVDSLQSPSMSSGCNAGNPTVPEKSDIADGYSQFANAGGGHYWLGSSRSQRCLAAFRLSA